MQSSSFIDEAIRILAASLAAVARAPQKGSFAGTSLETVVCPTLRWDGGAKMLRTVWSNRC